MFFFEFFHYCHYKNQTQNAIQHITFENKNSKINWSLRNHNSRKCINIYKRNRTQDLIHLEMMKRYIFYWKFVFRCVVATEDIKEGDLLFVDQPVVTGPKQTSPVICLGCYRQLDSWNYYACSKLVIVFWFVIWFYIFIFSIFFI